MAQNDLAGLGNARQIHNTVDAQHMLRQQIQIVDTVNINHVGKLVCGQRIGEQMDEVRTFHKYHQLLIMGMTSYLNPR